MRLTRPAYLVLIPLAMTLSACGPTAAELGAATLGASPIIVLASLIPAVLLHRFMRNPWPSDRTSLLLVGATLGFSMVCSAYGFLNNPGEDADLFKAAAIICGAAFLFYGQIAYWVTRAFSGDKPFGLFLPIALALHVAPAAFLMSDLFGRFGFTKDHAMDLVGAVWMLPSYMGLPGAVLFAAGMLYAYRRHRSEGAQAIRREEDATVVSDALS